MHSRMVLAAGAMVFATGIVAASLPAAAATHGPASRVSGYVPVRGAGHAIMLRSINVRKAEAGPQIAPHGRSFGPLGRNGKVAGSTLPALPSSGVKQLPASPPVLRGAANTGRSATTGAATPRSVIGPLAAPTTVDANFDGITQGNSDCGGCQPPDPSAAVSPSEIAQTVNLRLQVYDKSGTLLCGVGLNTLASTGESLSDPRIQWDNVYNRFSMVFIPVPGSDVAPAEYLLTTQTPDACGSWWVYRITFSGSLYPAGTLLDYPYLGQDNVPSNAYPAGGAILSSTNNFCCASNGFASYIGSAAFAVPKYPAYNGLGFSFPAFSVAFSTAPVTMGGIPMPATSNTYWVASVPGSGYDLYVMTNSSQNGTTLALQAAISSAFSAPSRRVNQPGTSQTLDPLDGRIVWTPVLAGNYVWFTHGIDISGYPSVRYGALGVLDNSATVAVAFHSGTSDDFNPSISVFPVTQNTIYAWVNWAYTDAPNGVATSDTVDGVLPGTGVPNLIGSDMTLASGFSTASNFRFGDFSSVEVDPVAASSSCPAGQTAVLSQEYFDGSGQWVTRIARTSFC